MKYILFFTFILFLACSEQSTEPTNLYTVSGVIYQNNQPSYGTNVSIDNKLNLSTTTDENGEFSIPNVPEGNRSFSASKSYDDGSFVETTSTLSVNNDIRLNSLILPNPTKLNEITYKTDSSIKLSWSPSSALDFREYKIYRHTTLGIDEQTGTLVYVTIDRNDTSFTDENLDALQTYYYRVFVMNEFARMGGSNIVSATTDNKNYIWNGDFELEESPLVWWNSYHFGQIIITDSLKTSGDNSLLLIAETGDPYNPPENLYADLSKWGATYYLVGDRTYKISGWIKTEGEYSEYVGDFWGDQTEEKAGFLSYNFFGVLGIKPHTDWTYVEKTFYISAQDVNDFSLSLRSSCKYTWFDNLKLEIVE
jgi:hypothetical protein